MSVWVPFVLYTDQGRTVCLRLRSVSAPIDHVARRMAVRVAGDLAREAGRHINATFYPDRIVGSGAYRGRIAAG